jgi:hypothetical protein
MYHLVKIELNLLTGSSMIRGGKHPKLLRKDWDKSLSPPDALSSAPVSFNANFRLLRNKVVENFTTVFISASPENTAKNNRRYNKN